MEFIHSRIEIVRHSQKERCKMNNRNTTSQKSEESKSSKLMAWTRNATFLFLALLALQFWLGMSINLEVNIPVKHLGALGSLLYFGSHFTFVLVHIVNGFSILAVAILILIFSIRSSYKSLRIISAIELASVAGAIVNGILFLESGQFFGWSIGMAMSAVSALIAASVELYVLGGIIGKAVISN